MGGENEAKDKTNSLKPIGGAGCEKWHKGATGLCVLRGEPRVHVQGQYRDRWCILNKYAHCRGKEGHDRENTVKACLGVPLLP